MKSKAEYMVKVRAKERAKGLVRFYTPLTKTERKKIVKFLKELRGENTNN